MSYGWNLVEPEYITHLIKDSLYTGNIESIFLLLCGSKRPCFCLAGDGRGCDRMVVLQLAMQSVPIVTNVVSSNPAQARATQYNIMW